MRNGPAPRGPVFLPDPVNFRHPLNRGRLCWWLTLSGLAAGKHWYDIAGGNHGTLTYMGRATAGWRGSTRPGGRGHMLFDAQYDNVTGNPGVVFAGGSPRPTSITTSAWFKIPNGNNYQILLANRAGRGEASGPLLILYGNSPTLYLSTSPGSWTGVISGPYFTVNQWHWLAMTYDERTGYAALYLDGQRVAYQNLTPSPIAYATENGECWKIGGDDIAYSGEASVDDASIWDRPLSPAELAWYYQLSRRGYPGLLNFWRPSALVEDGGAGPSGGWASWYACRGSFLGGGLL